MKVILLAWWKSSRMKPLSDKSLFKICWKSVIQHQVETILWAWFSDFVIVCNDENIWEIKKIFLENKKFTKNNFEFVIQKNQNDGMKWAIEDCVKKIEKDVLIVSSNDIVEKDIFKKIARESQKWECFWLICGKVVEKYFPGWYVSVDEKWFLKDIVEKPWEGNEPSNKINLVIHYWKNFQDFHKKLQSFDNSTDNAYEQCIKFFAQKKCEKIKIIDYNWYWQAIKYPWHLLLLNNFFLENQKKNQKFEKIFQKIWKIFWKWKNKISKSTQIAESAILKWEWIIVEKWAKILENAVLVGPVYIWENSIIWTNSFIRESSIWKNCVIWFSTEIARSLVQDNVNFHKNYIWDSVIDSWVNIWWWTVTWNLRLDKWEIKVKIKWERVKTWMDKIWVFIWKNAQLGINLSLNPGLKIWKWAMLVGWVWVFKDIE